MSRKTYIDLTDLITYAANFDQISGIQRVEIELIKLILRQYHSVEIINAYDVGSSVLRDILDRYIDDEELLLQKLNEAFLYCNAGPKHGWRKPPDMIVKMVARDILRFFTFRLPAIERGSLVFVPGGFSFDPFSAEFHRRLFRKGARLVFLVHDVLPITQPKLVPGGGSVFMSSFALPSDIVTTTEFNAADFRRAFQMLTRKQYRSEIHIVPLAHEFPGALRNESPGEPSPRLAEHLHGRNFALSVGTVDIRKNHIRLLNAWCALHAELGDALPLLVIAGRRGREAEAALTILDRAQLYSDPLMFIEAPSDDELKWLNAVCLFSVVPSLVEGWGLPVGESLWFGKACAASNTSSLPEAGGDLCVYFDPYDEGDIKRAIRQLLDPDSRQSFEAKIKAAHLRSWADVARDLMAVLLELAHKQMPAR